MLHDKFATAIWKYWSKITVDVLFFPSCALGLNKSISQRWTITYRSPFPYDVILCRCSVSRCRRWWIRRRRLITACDGAPGPRPTAAPSLLTPRWRLPLLLHRLLLPWTADLRMRMSTIWIFSSGPDDATIWGTWFFSWLFCGCASFDFFQWRTSFFPLKFSNCNLRNF